MSELPSTGHIFEPKLPDHDRYRPKEENPIVVYTEDQIRPFDRLRKFVAIRDGMDRNLVPSDFFRQNWALAEARMTSGAIHDVQRIGHEDDWDYRNSESEEMAAARKVIQDAIQEQKAKHSLRDSITIEKPQE